MTDHLISRDAPRRPPRLAALELRGQVVRLVPLGSEHFEDLLGAALSDPHLWDYTSTRVRSAVELRAWLDAAVADRAVAGLSLPFAVLERSSGRAVGSTRLMDYRPRDGGVEIGGTWYARSVWATRVNPECKLLLLRHAFEQLRCIRVQFKTDARNLRSRAAIIRLGATEEGTLRKHMVVRGSVVRDSVYFSVLDDEWPSVEAGLLARLEVP